MKNIIFTCDRCNKSTNTLYQCYMRFLKYDSIYTEGGNTSDNLDLCKACLEEYKSMFRKRKPLQEKRPEAEA